MKYIRAVTPLTWVAALAAALPALPAAGQDADGDGVTDLADAYPCDGAWAAVAFSPAEDQHGVLLFEDQWPALGDADFNDAVITYHYAVFLDGQGQAVAVRATFNVLALGGVFDNGLGLHLPIPAARVLTAHRTVGASAATPLPVRASDAELTVTVSANLRELFGGRAGPINAGEGPTALAPAVQVDLQLAPTALDLGAAPFDLFLFRAADLGHELHRTPYPGTALMHGALFNSHSDASRGGRWFVDARGLPFVLHLPVYALYPREGVDVARLWPRILGFAASGGAAEQDFYTGAAVLTEAYTGAPVPQPALLSPLPASDASCVGPQGLTQAFTPAQGCQAFVVPAGVTRLEAKAWGGGGGGAILNGGGHGGGGAFVQATLQVTPGESLLVCAGAGGALKTQDNWHGGGGGGLSGVFRGPYAQANALLIAAGGGGAVHCADGGAGGAPSGGKGRSCGGDLFGGGGGTPTAGGAAGGHISNTAPQAGRALLGGRGGDPEHSGYSSDVAGGGAAGAIGGGGGGGFFGGGGGGHHSGANGGAGGGGSSQAVDPAAVMAAGVAPEAGGALDPDHPAGVGRGGSGASRGEPGHVLLRW